jgi:hypothetical protein
VEVVMGFFPAPDVNIVPLVRDDEMWMELVEAEAPVVHADYESLLMGVPDDPMQRTETRPGRWRRPPRGGRYIGQEHGSVVEATDRSKR